MKFPTIFTLEQARLAVELKELDETQRRGEPLDPMDPRRLKALSRPVAEFVLMSVLQRRARRIAEFGTSHGYSTLFLAAAAARTGGKVYTVDRMPEKTAAARGNLERANLDHVVEFHTCEAAEFAQALPAELDFVLFDFQPGPLGRDLEDFKSKFAEGGFMFVDGGVAGTWEDIDEFRVFKESFEEDPRFMATILELVKEQLTVVRL